MLYEEITSCKEKKTEDKYKSLERRIEVNKTIMQEKQLAWSFQRRPYNVVGPSNSTIVIINGNINKNQ